MAVALLVVGGLALSGCRGGAAQATTDDPCALVTREEVVEHLGGDEAVGEGRPPGPGAPPPIGVTGMRFCIFDGGGEGRRLVVGVTPQGADTTYARRLFEEWQDRVLDDDERGELDEVPDVGVEAVYWPHFDQLVVLTDERVLGITVSMGNIRPELDADAGERQRARRLADLLLNRGMRPVFDEESSDETDADSEDEDASDAEDTEENTEAGSDADGSEGEPEAESDDGAAGGAEPDAEAGTGGDETDADADEESGDEQ